MTKMIIPRPTPEAVDSYLKKWDKLENYHLQEDALNKAIDEFDNCFRLTSY